MLMQSYLAAIACNDERVRKVIQREMLDANGRPKPSIFGNKSLPAKIDVRDTCTQRLNDLYFQNNSGNNSNSLLDNQNDSSNINARMVKSKNQQQKVLQCNQITQQPQQPKLKRAASASLFSSPSPRDVPRQSSFNLQQKQQGIKQACERIPQKVTLRCNDGTVIVNGDKAPLFVPKLDLTKITENREIYHPLPVARRAVLKQNDEIFQCVMSTKSFHLCKIEESEESTEQQPPQQSQSARWSVQSDVPSEPSETIMEESDSDSDLDSCYQKESTEIKNTKQKPRRRRTFTFKCVNSILDKVCRIQTEQENCLLTESGKSVMQSIEFQRTKSQNCFVECGVEV